MSPIEQAILDERQRCAEVHTAITAEAVPTLAGYGLSTKILEEVLRNARYEFARRALIAQYNAAGFKFPPK